MCSLVGVRASLGFVTASVLDLFSGWRDTGVNAKTKKKLAGFNPSQSSFVQQDLEDCGPDHNNCDGGAYTDPDYNRAGFY